MDSYNELNKAILEKARNGENSISFDFIDSKLKVDENYETIKLNNNRIYPHSGVCYALHNTYEYPDYLIARGFNVEIRKAQKRHGYVTKSYFISWWDLTSFPKSSLKANALRIAKTFIERR